MTGRAAGVAVPGADSFAEEAHIPNLNSHPPPPGPCFTSGT